MRIFLIAVLLICPPSFGKTVSDTDIIDYAKELGAKNPELVLAIVKTESMNRPWVINKEDAIKPGGPSYGLMQVKVGTARMLGFRGKEQKLLDWKINMKYGVKYIDQKLNQFQSVDKAAAAYNAGTVYICRRSCKKGNFVNQEYVNKVMINLKNITGDSDIIIAEDEGVIRVKKKVKKPLDPMFHRILI